MDLEADHLPGAEPDGHEGRSGAARRRASRFNDLVGSTDRKTMKLPGRPHRPGDGGPWPRKNCGPRRPNGWPSGPSRLEVKSGVPLAPHWPEAQARDRRRVRVCTPGAMSTLAWTCRRPRQSVALQASHRRDAGATVRGPPGFPPAGRRCHLSLPTGGTPVPPTGWKPVLRAADQDPRQEHQHAAHHDLENADGEGAVHVAVADPGDREQLDGDDRNRHGRGSQNRWNKKGST